MMILVDVFNYSFHTVALFRVSLCWLNVKKLKPAHTGLLVLVPKSVFSWAANDTPA